MSEKKKSGLSGALTALIAVVVIVRIGMIMSRNGNSANPGWDSTYLIWSMFFLVFIVGTYFWNRSKNSKNEEN